DALDIEPVARAELQLETPEAPLGSRLLRTARHVVRVAEPDRPRRRRAPAAQAQQAVNRQAEQLSLQVVQRCIERPARGELLRRQPLEDLVEREGIVAQGWRVFLEVRDRG